MRAGGYGGQKRMENPLYRLELQVIKNHVMGSGN